MTVAALYYDTTHSAAHNQNVFITNNILTGPATYLVHGATPAAGHSWVEKNNRFYNWGTGWNWNGTAYTSLASWTSAAAGSGGTVVKGAGSSTGNPSLSAAPALVPADATLTDAGTTSVHSALTFTKVA